MVRCGPEQAAEGLTPCDKVFQRLHVLVWCGEAIADSLVHAWVLVVVGVDEPPWVAPGDAKMTRLGLDARHSPQQSLALADVQSADQLEYSEFYLFIPRDCGSSTGKLRYLGTANQRWLPTGVSLKVTWTRRTRSSSDSYF